MPITPPDGNVPQQPIWGPRGPEKKEPLGAAALIVVLKNTLEQLRNASAGQQKVSSVRDYDKLVTQGVTCNQLSNGLIFPSGGLAPRWGTSEAMGNWMRDALKNGDTKLFQSLINSYYHVCRQAPDHMGLMPWSIDKTGKIVAEGNDSGRGSATDADQDIISSLIDAVAQNPNLTMTDPTDGATIKASDMLKVALANFTRMDCGSTNGLTGGSTMWQFGPGFTDYLDLTALTKMKNYCQQNGLSNEATILDNAMRGMMDYVKKELAGTGIPANAGDGTCAIYRVLYRMTEFIAFCKDPNNPYYQEALSIVQNLLVKGVKSGAIQISPNQKGINMQVPGSWLNNGAQTSAPLYMTMKLLNDRGLLPSELVPRLPEVKTAFDADMNNQFANIQSLTEEQYNGYGTPTGDYFGLTLGILNESLLKEYS